MKKAVLIIATIFTAANFFVAITTNVHAAKCLSGDGQQLCSGECCAATHSTCLAGPCQNVEPA